MSNHTTHSTLSNRRITIPVTIAVLILSIVSLAVLPPVIAAYVATPLLILSLFSLMLHSPPPSYIKYHY